jgi:nucleoid DNA-binding protein
MDSLKRGYKIPLMGLGKLYVRESKARTGRNPATGEMIHIPKRKRVRFTAAKALKERVL